MFCTKCGKQIPDKSGFCSYCGSATCNTQGSQAPQSNTTSPPDSINQGQVLQPYPSTPQRISSAATLRPLSLGEVFDKTIKLIATHWKSLLPLVGLMLMLYMAYFLCFSLLGFNDPMVMQKYGAGIIPILILIVSITGIFFLYFYLAIVKTVCDLYVEGAADIKESLTVSFEKLIPCLGAGILFFAATFIGTLALCIGGFYAFLSYMLYPFVMMSENKGAIDSLKRSGTLVNGSRLKLLLIVAIVNFILMIPGILLSGAVIGRAITGGGLDPQGATVVQQILSLVLNVITLPFAIVPQCIFYYDLRVRKEGYDIELAMSGK